MTEIHCDYCKEEIRTEIVQQLCLTINQCSRPGAGYNYPTQPYPLKALDICPDCAARFRQSKVIAISLAEEPPKK